MASVGIERNQRLTTIDELIRCMCSTLDGDPTVLLPEDTGTVLVSFFVGAAVRGRLMGEGVE